MEGQSRKCDFTQVRPFSFPRSFLEFFLRKRVQELCGGTFNRPAKLDKDLHCHWLHQNNPFLKVGPFKFEFKHKYPDIGYIHDMVCKAEVERIKKG